MLTARQSIIMPVFHSRQQRFVNQIPLSVQSLTKFFLQATPSPNYAAPSPGLGYSPMTPGSHSPYTPQTPGHASVVGDSIGSQV